jgi:hypothetical protein
MQSAVVILLLFFFSLPLTAQVKFQTVDIPGAVETQVRGINSAGVIVGFYRTSAQACIPFAPSTIQVSPCDERGFKFVNGKITTLMVPGSLSTAVMGMNDAGDMVGYYTKTSDACIEQHAFIWSHKGVIKNLDYPDYTGFCGTDALWTIPFDINNAGTAVGAVWDVVNGIPSGGFIYKNGRFAPMNPAGLDGGCLSCTSVASISNGGMMVGTAYRVFGVIPMWTGFMKRGQNEIYFTNSQDDTWVTGVNAAGDVVGYGIYGNGFFIKHLKHSLEVGSTVVTPDLIAIGYPEAVGTYPFAISSSRVVVGSYMSEDGSLHGFVAIPD